MSEQLAIKIKGLKKEYRLGQIGGGTLTADLQSWWARVRHKEDPNSKIGTDQRLMGQRFWALNGIDLEIKKGEAIGIIGGNGAGKSTMLKILSRITAPTEGSVDIYGRIASMLEVGTGFSPEMTGRENIYMNGAILGMTKAEIDAKMEDIIEFSEVREFIDTPVKRYSSGMYVKLAFSVAAHLDSEIMIMDEVLAVGDMAFQKKCLDKMRDAATVQGKTVLYVSHNMNTIRKLCDRCIVLDKARIIFDGDVEEAIAIYLGKNGSDLPLVYDLWDVSRPSTQHGEVVRIKTLQFLTEKQAVFKRSEPVRFKIVFEARKDIEGLKMYLPIRSSNGSIVGMTQTFEKIADVVSGTMYEFIFSLDCSNFAEDTYHFALDLFSDDGNGKHWSVDHPAKDVLFKVINDDPKGLEWKPQHYGYIQLNEIIATTEVVVSENH